VWVLTGLAIAVVVGIMVRTVRLAGRPQGAGDPRLGADAAVTRGGQRVAGIDRVVSARGRGRLPLYLAPARGAVIDSARVGVLAAWLLPGTEVGVEPRIALVPRDSVAGLAVVARLVVTPGEPGLLVFGARGSRPERSGRSGTR
jgi:hypothetical protein